MPMCMLKGLLAAVVLILSVLATVLVLCKNDFLSSDEAYMRFLPSELDK